jgi:hypothetical protein
MIEIPDKPVIRDVGLRRAIPIRSGIDHFQYLFRIKPGLGAQCHRLERHREVAEGDDDVAHSQKSLVENSDHVPSGLHPIQVRFLARPGCPGICRAADTSLLVIVWGSNYEQQYVSDITSLPIPLVGEPNDRATRLARVGLGVINEGDKAMFDSLRPGTKFEVLSRAYDFYADGNPVIASAVKMPDDRVMKEIFYIPALPLLGLVIMLQCRCETQPAF